MKKGNRRRNKGNKSRGGKGKKVNRRRNRGKIE